MNEHRFSMNDAEPHAAGALAPLVMRRVRTIYVVRQAFKSPFVRAGVLVASCAVIAVDSSVPAVISNMSHLPSVSQYEPYIWGAFTHTKLAVQAGVVLALLSGAWLASGAVRSVRYGKLGMRAA
ncbi:MAG: hypothetical protein KGI69_02975 [Patescibacteria group bacterium]|nr:hypothetical protein [Patescibacteria group bacterium]